MIVQDPFRPSASGQVPDDLSTALARWENESGALEGGELSDLHRGTFGIDPVSPFRLDLSVWALRRRPGNTVDRWDGTSYRRALALAGGPVGPGARVVRAARRGVDCLSV